MAIIIKPIVTEKMTGMGEKFNRYGFAVTPDADKQQIKDCPRRFPGYRPTALP